VEAKAGFGYSGGPLGSQIQFFRFSALFTAHLQLNPSLIITLHTEGETIVPEISGSIPISKRLYAGGSSSVRSFPEDRLSPVDVNGVPVGGLTHLEGTIEIRIQLIDNLILALFSDIGMVAQDPFSVAEPGFGIGMGLRYRLPIGPLRLDIGYNPGPRFAADSGWALHFSIGSGY
jgi:outer membrane protein insertion porin family/translocation and assembly module TamA